MNLTIPTEPQERAYVDDHGIEWRYMVTAAMEDDYLEELQAAGDRFEMSAEGASPAALLGARRLAYKHVTAIVSAGRNGEAASINGKPATDESVREVALKGVAGLASHAAREALELGQLAEEERGNSESAPDS